MNQDKAFVNSETYIANGYRSKNPLVVSLAFRINNLASLSVVAVLQYSFFL